MTLSHFLMKAFLKHAPSRRKGPRHRGRSHGQAVRPMLMVLEDRLAPAVLTVNSLADGPSSGLTHTLDLREAIVLIDSGGTAVDSSGNSLALAKASQIDTTEPFGTMDTIRFDPSLFSSTQQLIALLDSQLLLDRSVVILGPGADLLAVSGNGQSPVFAITGGVTVSFSGLTITDGSPLPAGTSAGGGILNYGVLTVFDSAIAGTAADNGGGIANYGVLTLIASSVSNNAAVHKGGAVFNTGTLTLVDSTISDNVSQNDAGIVTTGGAVVLVDSTVSGNSAAVGNGGLASYGGALTLVDSAITGNSALGAGGIGNYGGTLTITESTITGNAATEDGAGGIYNRGSLTMKDSLVTANSAAEDADLYNTGSLTISNTIVPSSSARQNDGDLLNDGPRELTDPAIFENAGVDGDGSLADHGMPLLIDRVGADESSPAATASGDSAVSWALTDSSAPDHFVTASTGEGFLNTETAPLLSSTLVDNSHASDGIATIGASTFFASTVAGNPDQQLDGDSLGNNAGPFAASSHRACGAADSLAMEASDRVASLVGDAGCVPPGSHADGVGALETRDRLDALFGGVQSGIQPKSGDAAVSLGLPPGTSQQTLSLEQRRHLLERCLLEMESVPLVRWEQGTDLIAQIALGAALAAFWSNTSPAKRRPSAPAFRVPEPVPVVR